MDARQDTIFATSSGAPPAAIAIVRISGPAAFEICTRLVGLLPEARRAALRSVRNPRDGSLLDRALILVFPAPDTATGEDVAELHVHGGRAVVAAVEAAIASFPHVGIRRAEPGEFTRRALENGVIDLTGAEGLGDLLAAETETQRRAALRMAEGGVRSLIEGWTTRLVAIAARVEARLDFSDEDDVVDREGGTERHIVVEVIMLSAEIDAVLRQPPVERLRDGLRVVIAGPPNSGKSTLLNALTGRAVSIVSSISGTTRDRIEAPVARDGVAYILTDTAGLTETSNDEIELVGVDLAKTAMAGADILLWLGDEDVPEHLCAISVHAMADLPGRQILPGKADVAISAVAGEGLAALWNLIADRASKLLPLEDAVAINQRQRSLLSECRNRLDAAVATEDLLIMADELRVAGQALDAVTGRSGVEDVLDALFATFCIGK